MCVGAKGSPLLYVRTLKIFLLCVQALKNFALLCVWVLKMFTLLFKWVRRVLAVTACTARMRPIHPSPHALRKRGLPSALRK